MTLSAFAVGLCLLVAGYALGYLAGMVADAAGLTADAEQGGDA